MNNHRYKHYLTQTSIDLVLKQSWMPHGSDIVGSIDLVWWLFFFNNGMTVPYLSLHSVNRRTHEQINRQTDIKGVPGRQTKLTIVMVTLTLSHVVNWGWIMSSKHVLICKSPADGCPMYILLYWIKCYNQHIILVPLYIVSNLTRL